MGAFNNHIQTSIHKHSDEYVALSIPRLVVTRSVARHCLRRARKSWKCKENTNVNLCELCQPPVSPATASAGGAREGLVCEGVRFRTTVRTGVRMHGHREALCRRGRRSLKWHQ